MLAAAWLGIKALSEYVWDFLVSLPWWVWLTAGIIALGLFWGHLQYNAGQADIQKKFDTHLAADRTAADKAKAEALGKELAQRASFAAIQSKLVSENADARAEIDRLSTDLAAGRVRLRSHFTCRPVLPTTTTSTGRRDEAGETGFNDQDARIAFGISNDGDNAIRQLQACQAILKAERE